jgi:hypothetical protein
MGEFVPYMQSCRKRKERKCGGGRENMRDMEYHEREIEGTLEIQRVLKRG